MVKIKEARQRQDNNFWVAKVWVLIGKSNRDRGMFKMSPDCNRVKAKFKDDKRGRIATLAF
jgi:hypothetical protein